MSDGLTSESDKKELTLATANGSEAINFNLPSFDFFFPLSPSPARKNCGVRPFDFAFEISLWKSLVSSLTALAP